VNDPSNVNYRVQRLTPEYTRQIPELVTRVNGPAYIHPEVYHPDAMWELNAAKRLISVIALDDQDRVVGHSALERPALERVCEIGEAMVLPEHRHHHLLDRMRDLLEEAGRSEGLFAMYGNAVTHHIFSQRTEERAGSTPVAILLAHSPAESFHVDYPQRVSTVTYLKVLGQFPPLQIHPPEHHREMLASIYAHSGRLVEWGEPQPASSEGKLASRLENSLGRGSIRVEAVGVNSAAQVLAASESLAQAAVVYVEVPLADPGCAGLCRELEGHGFFFNGIAASEPDRGGDCLVLALLRTPLDFSLIELDGDFARNLLTYIETARSRTKG
jgi:RimJ/RimL family protein N-acetyltransferase